MTDLEALIADLEKAAGPSRELDRAVAAALGYRVALVSTETADPWVIVSGVGARPLPRYTSSLDAAVSLVPEEWAIFEMGESGPRGPGGPGWWVTLMHRNTGKDTGGWHKVFAIALCIAALKARLP